MKKVVVIALVAIFGLMSVNAQKLGHVNVADVVQNMPETKAAENTIKTQSEAKSADIKSRQDALESKMKSFQDKVQGLTQDQIQQQAQALQSEQESMQKEAQEIEKLRGMAMQAMQQKQNELLAPIEEKAYNAIQKVAEAKGLDYVIDSSSGILVRAEGNDITPDVKKELGIQ